MKMIKGFENEDIIVSDFGEWVGKNYIDYKSEYKNNQKIIKRLLDENKQLKDNWDKLKVYIKTEIPEDVFIDTEWFVSILDKMKELERGE